MSELANKLAPLVTSPVPEKATLSEGALQVKNRLSKLNWNTTRMMMKFFSPKTFMEVVSQIVINITSGWFGILLVSPRFFGISQDIYFRL